MQRRTQSLQETFVWPVGVYKAIIPAGVEENEVAVVVQPPVLVLRLGLEGVDIADVVFVRRRRVSHLKHISMC